VANDWPSRDDPGHHVQAPTHLLSRVGTRPSSSTGRPRPAGPRLPTGGNANRESPRVGPRDGTPPRRLRSSPRLGRTPKASTENPGHLLKSESCESVRASTVTHRQTRDRLGLAVPADPRECMRLHRRESICTHADQQAGSKHSVCQSMLEAILFRINIIRACSSRRDAPDPTETYSQIQETESPRLVDPSRPTRLLPSPGTIIWRSRGFRSEGRRGM